MSEAEKRGYLAALTTVEDVIKGLGKPVDPLFIVQLMRDDVRARG